MLYWSTSLLGKNSPGTTSGTTKTISAAEYDIPSLGVVRFWANLHRYNTFANTILFRDITSYVTMIDRNDDESFALTES